MWEIEEENKHNIELKGKTIGIVRTICPFCSHTRKKENQTTPCLYVDMDESEPYYYCHNCLETGRVHKYRKVKDEDQDTAYTLNEAQEGIIPQSVYDYFLNERAISKTTVDRMKIRYIEAIYFLKPQKNRGAIAFPYIKHGYIVNYKYRSAKKDFMMQKGCDKPFYNIDAIRFTDCVVIQEGEFDVMSSVECGIPHAVSPPNGANDKGMKWLDDTYEVYFKDKKNIIIAVDQDAAGEDLKERLAARLGKHRCHVVNWGDCKDGNEYLKKHGKEKYILAIENAEPYPVAGVFVLGRSVMDKLILEHEGLVSRGSSLHIKSLKDHLSWVKGDVYVWAGYSNIGKSEVFYNFAALKALHDGWKTAVAAFEDKTPDRFYRKFVEMYAGRRLSPEQGKYNNQMTRKELEDAMDWAREHFVYVKPPNKFTREATMDAFAGAIARYGVDMICIDPLNKMVKEQTHLRDDEYLIEYYTEQEQFATEWNVVSNTITHANKPPSFDKGGVPQRPNRFTILGGQAASNAADNIIFAHKSSVEWDDPLREIIVEKVRDRDIVGIPGEVVLKFDYRKRRYLDKSSETEWYDPFVGEGNHPKRTAPIPLNEQFDTEDVPF